MHKATGPRDSGTGRTVPASEKVDLIEETATVHTREVVTGKVRVTTSTETVDDVQRTKLYGIDTDIKRVPIDRMLERDEQPSEPQVDGDTIVIPIFEEVAVVETRLVLKEELHITQTRTTETVEIPLKLRKQSANIDRVATEDNNS